MKHNLLFRPASLALALLATRVPGVRTTGTADGQSSAASGHSGAQRLHLIDGLAVTHGEFGGRDRRPDRGWRLRS
jgi:hypothetical protein